MSTPPLRRSRRHATIIPVSDWISIGYSEDDALLMNQIQGDMKHYRDNEDEDTIVLGEESSNSRYQPNDWMIPHWKELFKALHGRTIVDTFYIRHINLLSVLDIMFPALQSMNLEKLGLKGTDLGTDGLQSLISFLKRNSSLHELYIDINGDIIDDMTVASTFSDALKEHPTLNKLLLYNGGLNNANVLRIILEGCTRLNHVELNDNIGSEAVGVLFDFISGNHPTEYLFLQHNKITDSDTILLASALNKNTNLTQFDLSGNDNITEEGEKTLLNALFDPTGMDSIIESNHTCIVHTYDVKSDTAIAQRPLFEQEVFKINLDGGSVKQKIRKKVVLALCGQDGELFDLSHLNDLPIQLMPRVLELIQEHSQSRTKGITNSAQTVEDFVHGVPNQLEKDALTRLFHTLRGWELPLLFEHLQGPSSKGGGKKRKRRKTRR